jgi:predicted DNA-binding transcriptional regulator YafY
MNEDIDITSAEAIARKVQILYTNYRGETAVRTILPIKIWFGATDWHPEAQWLLDAIDFEKGAKRSFALKDIKSWSVE